jgi:Nucleolar pre-ribosomal-associated protein 1
LDNKWISEPAIVGLANALIFTGSKIKVDYTKHFQILINIDGLKITREISLLLYRLFCFDKSRHSNRQVIDKLVLFFQGRRSFCDALLLRMLKFIETHLNGSWCNGIDVWTLRNSSLASEQVYMDENLPLIVKGETGQELTLDIRVILQTVKKGKNGISFEPPIDDAPLDDWEKFLLAYRTYHEDTTIYDEEFLIFALVSCQEIYREDGNINLKLFVESGGLSFAICSLASEVPDISRAASTIILSVTSFLSTPEVPAYRENTIICILLSKILLHANEYPEKALAPSIFIFISQLLLVLINPGHHLYERAVDYVLAGPGLRQELPMIKSIMNSDSKDSFKDIQWGLETLTNALNTKTDLYLYENFGIFEWVMTLSLSPYFEKSKIKLRIVDFLTKTAEVTGGSSALLTRHAGLVWNASSVEEDRQKREQQLRYLFTTPRDKISEWTDHTLHDIF